MIIVRVDMYDKIEQVKRHSRYTHYGFGNARDLNFLYVTFSILECEHASFGQVGGGEFK